MPYFRIDKRYTIDKLIKIAKRNPKHKILIEDRDGHMPEFGKGLESLLDYPNKEALAFYDYKRLKSKIVYDDGDVYIFYIVKKRKRRNEIT